MNHTLAVKTQPRRGKNNGIGTIGTVLPDHEWIRSVGGVHTVMGVRVGVPGMAGKIAVRKILSIGSLS